MFVEESMVKRSMWVLLCICVASGTLWAADSPLIGKWKLNPARSRLTDVMKVNLQQLTQNCVNTWPFALFAAQRLHGVCGGGTAGRDPGCDESGGCDSSRNSDENGEVP